LAATSNTLAASARSREPLDFRAVAVEPIFDPLPHNPRFFAALFPTSCPPIVQKNPKSFVFPVDSQQ